jgi:hypothetical protein
MKLFYVILEPVQVPIVDVFVPKLWLYLAANVVTQYPFEY